MAGVSGATVAACLQSSQQAACFSASRLHANAIGAGVTAPGAPGGLTSSVSGSSVTLAWNAPASGDPVLSYILRLRRIGLRFTF